MIGLATLKSALRVTHDEDDDYITELEERAVEAVTGGAFTGGEVVEVVRGSGKVTLWLSRVPSSVTSVVGRAYPGGTETAVVEDATEGFDVRGSGLYRRGGGVWSADEEFEVTYNAPPSRKAVQAVEGLVILWYEKRLPDAERIDAENDIIASAREWWFA